MIKKGLFICLSLGTLFSAVFSGMGLLAFPSSRFFALLLAAAAIAVGVSFNVRKWSKAAALCLIVAIFTYFIAVSVDPREARQEYKSPEGSNTIVIHYDYASRPSIYRKENFLIMLPVEFDFGPGYNEIIRHEVSWITEDEIKLTDYYGQEWIVDIGRK